MADARDPRLNIAPGEDEDIAEALAKLGLDASDENIEQFSFFLEAMRLYEIRGRKYGDAWKQYGVTDSMFHVRSKVDRLGAVLTTDESHCYDDGIDLLNYAVFAMRNGLEGRQ